MRKVHTWLKPGGYFVTSTVCAGDMGWSTKLLLGSIMPIGRYFGLLPRVEAFTKQELKESFIKSGFKIEHEWQPKEGKAVFFIGKKA